jgi:hypothetical protein
VSFGDTESLAGLPLGVKPMAYGQLLDLRDHAARQRCCDGRDRRFARLVHPGRHHAPANLAAMADVIATPTSAWTTGQHVVLGDASKAYWNGTAWVAGQAS